MQGAIKMTWQDGAVGFVILPIHEYRNRGPVFRVDDAAQRGAHILSAAAVRGSWNAWVSELVRDEQIVDEVPAGIEVY